MRPNDGNPCAACLKKGCGKQAQCKAYMEYFQNNRKKNAKHLEQAKLNDYVTKAVYIQKQGTNSTASRYRPKGRW